MLLTRGKFESGCKANLSRFKLSPENAQQSLNKTLFNAIKERKFEKIQQAILCGADADAKFNLPDFKKKNVPLISIAIIFNNKKEVIQFIADHVKDIDARDSEQRTALMHASLHANVENLLIILRKKADVKAIDIYGNTCLIHAVVCSISNCNTLFDNGAIEIINARNNNGDSAFLIAHRNRSKGICDLLYKYKSEVPEKIAAEYRSKILSYEEYTED